MREFRVLSIGNSFSQDAQAYLHDMAGSCGRPVMAANLYIGGCSLERHWQNIEGDLADYDLEINGGEPERKISIAEALRLESEGWDAVTLQQASGASGLFETYAPYIGRIAETVREGAPRAKLWIHQTWAYETDSEHEAFATYGHDQAHMYRALESAYEKAASLIHTDGFIPSGCAIQALRGTRAFDYPGGGLSLCRDGFHLSIPYGRFAAACAWCEAMLGIDARAIGYSPPDADETLLGIIKETVHAAVDRYLANRSMGGVQ